MAVPVGKESADALSAKLTERVRSLRVGHSLDEKADYGPLITAEAAPRVEDYIQIGVDEGAELLVTPPGTSPPASTPAWSV